MFPGIGTVVNVATVLIGATIGVLLGHRLPTRIREVVTDALGLVTLLVAALSAFTVTDGALSAYVGPSAPVLIVLGSLVLGGIAGSLVGLEARLESLGGALQRRWTGATAAGDRQRFIEGFVTASLLFCTGPLTILGSLSDGLGRGADQLFLKSTLDGFAAIAFAASFGWGVAASALTVLTVQGAITLLGVSLGDVLPLAHVAAITATGGLVLAGVAFRLLRLREMAVADLLPALLIAPVLTEVVAQLR